MDGVDDPSKPIVARRRQIVQSAVDTVLWWLARSGPDSFADVLARHARLGSAAVVRHHFADRDELLAEIHRTLLTRFSRLAEPRITVETTRQGRARALVSAAVDYLHRSHRDAFALRVMAVETRTPGGWFTKTVPPQVAAVKDVIRRGQAAGPVPTL